MKVLTKLAELEQNKDTLTIVRHFQCIYKGCDSKSPLIEANATIFSELPFVLNIIMLGVKFVCEKHKH